MGGYTTGLLNSGKPIPWEPRLPLRALQAKKRTYAATLPRLLALHGLVEAKLAIRCVSGEVHAELHGPPAKRLTSTVRLRILSPTIGRRVFPPLDWFA